MLYCSLKVSLIFTVYNILHAEGLIDDEHYDYNILNISSA